LWWYEWNFYDDFLYNVRNKEVYRLIDRAKPSMSLLNILTQYVYPGGGSVKIVEIDSNLLRLFMETEMENLEYNFYKEEVTPKHEVKFLQNENKYLKDRNNELHEMHSKVKQENTELAYTLQQLNYHTFEDIPEEEHMDPKGKQKQHDDLIELKEDRFEKLQDDEFKRGSSVQKGSPKTIDLLEEYDCLLDQNKNFKNANHNANFQDHHNKVDAEIPLTSEKSSLDNEESQDAKVHELTNGTTSAEDSHQKDNTTQKTELREIFFPME